MEKLSSHWTSVFIVALVLSAIVKIWLASRQIRHVLRHKSQVPADFSDHISLEAHQKAADYTATKMRLVTLEVCFDAAVLLGWTFLGGLHALNQFLLTHFSFGPMTQQLALIGCFAVINSALYLPWTLYQTFVVEQRFGFNKMTFKLFVLDGIKGAIVGAVLGLPIVAAILALMGAAGPLWWLWAWGLWMGFNLLILLIYPTWIAPWFNKFQPLSDPALTDRVQALMQRCGFHAKGFYVMDGSKRSAHANAYFTGWGSSKRVVFYDTLLKQLSVDEVEAVLAHELGHFKHKHIVKRLVSLFAMSLLAFAALGWLSSKLWFYNGLGVEPNFVYPNNALALVLFMLVIPVFSFFISPLMAYWSRKHEFEADAYAIRQTRASDLKLALLKLYRDNASTLTPDPWFVSFYASHPPAAQRLARMSST